MDSQDTTAAQADATAQAPKHTNVTYVPGDDDPSMTVWGGIRFRANVPTAIPHAHPLHGQMVEQAKGNPFFKVEGHEQQKHAAPGGGVPKTAEAYRAYAVAWFRKAQTAAEFLQRWQAEGPMREKAGVGDDDMNWLADIGDPILAELRKADQEDHANLHQEE